MAASRSKKKKQEKAREEEALEAREQDEQRTAPEDEREPESEAGGKASEMEDLYLRARAELDNFRKRTAREKAALAEHVKASVFRDIIPLLDDFQRFFEHARQEEQNEGLDHSFVQGVEMIRNSLVKALDSHGVQAVDEEGVPVDYNLHEAVLTEPVEDPERDQTVLQVLEVGYRIGDTLIRPAKVKVGVHS